MLILESKSVRIDEEKLFFVDYHVLEDPCWVRIPFIPEWFVLEIVGDVLRWGNFANLRINSEAYLSGMQERIPEKMTRREYYFGRMYQEAHEGLMSDPEMREIIWSGCAKAWGKSLR